MTRIVLISTLFGLLAACETVEGVGEDVENLGEQIQQEEEEVD